MIDDTSGTSDVPHDVHIIKTMKMQMLKMVRFNLSIMHLILELKQLVKKEGQLEKLKSRSIFVILSNGSELIMWIVYMRHSSSLHIFNIHERVWLFHYRVNEILIPCI